MPTGALGPYFFLARPPPHPPPRTRSLPPQFLILCEKVLGFKDGKEVFHEPASGFKKVDFGESIGEKTVGGHIFIRSRSG